MTGLIYVSIVVLWAAVLVPTWLRRHDEAHRAAAEQAREAQQAQADEQAQAAGQARRAARTRPAPAGAVASPARTSPARTSPASTSPGRPVRASAAARRRRVLGVLAALTAAVWAVVAITAVPAWVGGLPVVLLGAFLATARRQVRRARRGAAPAGGAPAGGVEDRAVPAPPRRAVPAPRDAVSVDLRDAGEVIDLTAAAGRAAPRTAARASSRAAYGPRPQADGWQDLDALPQAVNS